MIQLSFSAVGSQKNAEADNRPGGSGVIAPPPGNNTLAQAQYNGQGWLLQAFRRGLDVITPAVLSGRPTERFSFPPLPPCPGAKE